MSERVEIVNGDSLLVMQLMDDNSVDAIVTDPPYGLSFMGKKWDYDVPSDELWRQCFRVLKAGGHLLCFAGTRTQHRMAVRIEDAGFEIRDMIAWVYGSGFPKSLDVSKAIDKAAGVEREVVGTVKKTPSASSNCNEGWVRPWAEGKTTMDITTPATDAAKQWQGWGTALKPALEPITVARKPLIGTVAENVLQHGTGAINVDGCRVGDNAGWSYPNGRGGTAWHGRDSLANNLTEPMAATQGRWPANFIHDGSEEVCALFPLSKSSDTLHPGSDRGSQFGQIVSSARTTGYSDYGSAARFFYCAKASKADRGENNHHPTVKPTDLMRYLCRLVTPPNGVVLDPFMGSGSTGKAAVLEGFRFIGIEREQEYCEIAKARIKHIQQ